MAEEDHEAAGSTDERTYMEPEPAVQPSDDDPDALDVSSRYCHRCGGLLLLTYYQDIHEDTGQMVFPALRCTVCGEVIDPVILKNRRAPAPNLLYGTKQRKYGQRVVPIDSTRKRVSDVSTDGQPDSEEA
jgi:hypothetical protein